MSIEKCQLVKTEVVTTAHQRCQRASRATLFHRCVDCQQQHRLTVDIYCCRSYSNGIHQQRVHNTMMEFPSLDPDSDGIPQLDAGCQCYVQPKGQRKFLETRWLQAKDSELERSQKESATTTRQDATKETGNRTKKIGRWKAISGNVGNPGVETNDGSPSQTTQLLESSTPKAPKTY